jgi:uncharacterized membrane protein
MSNTARWVISAILAVLGVIALIYAVIYLAVPIHSLPGFVPGKTAVNGHYHKRAAISAVIGIVLLAIAVVVALRSGRSTTASVGSAPRPATAQDAGGESGTLPS